MLETNLVSESYELPAVDEVERELRQAPDMHIINQRIHDVMHVLADFNNRRQHHRYYSAMCFTEDRERR